MLTTGVANKHYLSSRIKITFRITKKYECVILLPLEKKNTTMFVILFLEVTCQYSLSTPNVLLETEILEILTAKLIVQSPRSLIVHNLEMIFV